MTQHFDAACFEHGTAVAPARRDRGRRAFLSGAAAEERAIDAYRQKGLTLLAHRWRGQSGEIDLILKDASTYVFAEVKKAASLDAAIARLRPAQMRRIHLAASEFLGGTPDGQLSDVRFDLVVMDGAGALAILPEAFSHF